MNPHPLDPRAAPAALPPSNKDVARAAIGLTIVLLAGAALILSLTASPPLDPSRAGAWRGLALAVEAVLAGLFAFFALSLQRRSDRRRARLEQQDALRQSEDTFSLLVRSVKNYAIMLLDPTGRVASWNEGAERITGYSADEILGSSFERFFADEDVRQGRPQRLLESALRDGRWFDQGWRVRKDGSRYWTEASLTPLFDRSGSLRGYAKVTRDVSERRAAEERLQRSESLLSNAQRIARLGSWEWDVAADRLRCSSEFLRILGLDPSRSGLSLAALFEFIHPDDRTAVEAAFETARREQRVFQLEHRLVRADGEVRTLVTHGHVEADEAGRTARLIGTGQDITERKLIEEALRIQTDLYLSLLNAQSELGEGVLLAEGEAVVYANPALGALFGLEVNPPRTLASFLDALDPAGISPLRKDLLDRVNRPLPTARGETSLPRKDGSLVDIEYSVSAVPGPDRQRTFALFRDETERKRAERLLQESGRRLRQFSSELERAREEEATRISREIHDELGQLLTGLKLDLAWMAQQLDRAGSSDVPALLEKARSMSELADATIEHVRRIASELRPGVLDDLGLSAALEWQAGEFETRTGIRCRVAVDPEAEAVPPEHATAMFRIFQEALTNIARHAQAQHVTVALEKRDGGWLLTVRDDGRGITEAELHGSGSLGLLGMRERAHLLGGETVIRRGDPRGTVLEVSLPPAPEGVEKS
ncbi:MAG TPA: PAS domain S-box protein [Anaerolineales bacterium]|nr:PAS domain S-box protein [Anaerolineales bacterium]